MSNLNNKKEWNPLKSLWDIFCKVSGIISLASMADRIVAWKGFIASTIVSYRAIVDPIFNYLFSWLPIKMPRFIHDYIVLALIFSISFVRSVAENDPHYWGDPKEVPFFPYRLYNLTVCRFITIMKNVLLFPVIFLIVLPVGVIIHRHGSSQEEFRRAGSEAVGAYKWAGAIIVGLLLLLILNTAISKW